MSTYLGKWYLVSRPHVEIVKEVLQKSCSAIASRGNARKRGRLRSKFWLLQNFRNCLPGQRPGNAINSHASCCKETCKAEIRQKHNGDRD